MAVSWYWLLSDSVHTTEMALSFESMDRILSKSSTAWHTNETFRQHNSFLPSKKGYALLVKYTRILLDSCHFSQLCTQVVINFQWVTRLKYKRDFYEFQTSSQVLEIVCLSSLHFCCARGKKKQIGLSGNFVSGLLFSNSELKN